MIQNESRDPFGGNVYYVTMQITFLTRKFRNGERNLHCDVVHITTKWVSSLTLDCNGVFAIKATIVSTMVKVTIVDCIATQRCPTPEILIASPVISRTTSEPSGGRARMMVAIVAGCCSVRTFRDCHNSIAFTIGILH